MRDAKNGRLSCAPSTRLERAVVLADPCGGSRSAWRSQKAISSTLRHLSAEGVNDTAVITDQPWKFTAQHSIPAVPRVGFMPDWDRSRLDEELARYTESLLRANGQWMGMQVRDIVRASDLAVGTVCRCPPAWRTIHVYELAAVARTCDVFDKTLRTSLPRTTRHVDPRSRDLIEEIRSIAN